MMLPRPATVSQSIIVRVTHRYNTQAEQRDVFESHRHHVFSVAYYMTGDEREAEDILQSTFIEAFERETVPTVATLDKALMSQFHRRFSLDPVQAMTSEGEGLGNRNVRRTDLEEAVWQMPERAALLPAARCRRLRQCPDRGAIADLGTRGPAHRLFRQAADAEFTARTAPAA